MTSSTFEESIPITRASVACILGSSMNIRRYYRMEANRIVLAVYNCLPRSIENPVQIGEGGTKHLQKFCCLLARSVAVVPMMVVRRGMRAWVK